MSGRPWTAAEDSAMVARYPSEATKTLAADLGRSERAVYMRSNTLGLSKSGDYLASPQSGRKRKGCKPNSGTFKPGHATWNKGMDFHAAGRSIETQFKPGTLNGRAAQLYQPIGSERVSKDGTLERKVSDDPSMYPAKRWVAVARLVWEAAHGPIPPGHAVAFLPGRKTTDAALITADAVELVSRAELMRRNSYHNRYPKEIALLIQLRGAVNRQINKRANP